MNRQNTPRSPLQRPFVIGGAVIGVGLCAWYLAGNLGRSVPDPLWTRFVNVALILFVSIYVANLVRRMVDRLRSR
ncbi:hypothetical protein JFN93_01130 [Geomonas sp. Red875]|uniref:Uncharacterized protein n=2 Tax=Geomesophilobacter sediminis TaxID=2798584 RepID=A0A8J7M047_9BACT|nr:hypothetical protein [Geomesophilobacter sediminis]